MLEAARTVWEAAHPDAPGRGDDSESRRSSAGGTAAEAATRTDEAAAVDAAATVAPLVRELAARIRTGEPYTERKSTFQVSVRRPARLYLRLCSAVQVWRRQQFASVATSPSFSGSRGAGACGRGELAE